MPNPIKCKAMTVSRKRKYDYHTQFLLNGTFKYLGVLISSDLSWSAYIESICTKLRKAIGLLYRRFYGNVDQHILLELYSVLVRPHQEYAAPIWNPHLTKDINKLDVHFLRYMYLMHVLMPFNHLLDLALFLHGITYPMKHY